MLGLFSKKAMILGAPAAGQLLDITQVNDPFFASKNLGDGVAVIPQSQTVCAPCDGRLVMVFETRVRHPQRRGGGAGSYRHRYGADAGAGFYRAEKGERQSPPGRTHHSFRPQAFKRL